jgi:hypothetical protein
VIFLTVRRLRRLGCFGMPFQAVTTYYNGFQGRTSGAPGRPAPTSPAAPRKERPPPGGVRSVHPGDLPADGWPGCSGSASRRGLGQRLVRGTQAVVPKVVGYEEVVLVRSRRVRRSPYEDHSHRAGNAGHCPGWTLHLQRICIRYARLRGMRPPRAVYPRALAQPSGPDGKGQARGQAPEGAQRTSRLRECRRTGCSNRPKKRRWFASRASGSHSPRA